MVQAIDLLTQKASLNVHSTRFAPLTPDRIFQHRFGPRTRPLVCLYPTSRYCPVHIVNDIESVMIVANTVWPGDYPITVLHLHGVAMPALGSSVAHHLAVDSRSVHEWTLADCSG